MSSKYWQVFFFLLLLWCYSLVDCTWKLEMKLLYVDKSILLLSVCLL